MALAVEVHLAEGQLRRLESTLREVQLSWVGTVSKSWESRILIHCRNEVKESVRLGDTSVNLRYEILANLECERCYMVIEYAIYSESSSIPRHDQLLTSLLHEPTS
jgi:hypothetical protein